MRESVTRRVSRHGTRIAAHKVYVGGADRPRVHWQAEVQDHRPSGVGQGVGIRGLRRDDLEGRGRCGFASGTAEAAGAFAGVGAGNGGE